MEKINDAELNRTGPSRREFLRTGLAVAAASTVSSKALAEPATASQKKPNLVFILGEGHRADCLSIAGHPLLKTPNHDRIGREGLRFTNAFVTNALCAPARSAVLTGMHSRSTGALDNADLNKPLDIPYFTDMLQEAGYEIALVGKSHCRDGAADRKWDYYFGFNAPSTNYYAPKFMEGRKGEVGPVKTYNGFADDIALDKALAWLAEPRDKPFCLLFWPQTPHAPFFRERRHLDLYAGVQIPKPSTFDDDLKGYQGKPACFKEFANRIGVVDNIDAVRSVEELTKDYYAGLIAVDEMLGRLFGYLESKGIMDDTAIVHSSDHGFFLGEYSLYDKRLMHEPSIRVPMMLRYPKLFKAGTVRDEMVLDIDIAPTLLEIAGLQPRREMQGRSLVPFAQGPQKDWRGEWLYEYYEYPNSHNVPPNRGVRTQTHKLIHYYTLNQWEMYDVVADPQEKNNLIDVPQHAPLRKQLGEALNRLEQTIPRRAA